MEWEYIIAQYRLAREGGYYDQFPDLNKLGADRWELISTQHDHYTRWATLYFKRKKM